MAPAVPLLATRGIVKDYPGVRALHDVDFELRSGEVHVLFGENGAGKSTLIAMLSGAERPSAGHIEIRGHPTRLDSVQDARSQGISAVFQEFSLIPHMSVEENLFLGAEHTRFGFLQKSRMRSEARRILGELGFEVASHRLIERLSRAERQMVEIAKAFRSDLSVLILDEPTASLNDHEAKRLFTLIRQLTAMDVGIVYITHRIAEIGRIGNRVTILRDGRRVATLAALEAAEDRLVQLMTGREVGAIFPAVELPQPGAEVLQLDGVSTGDGSVRNVSITARRGEIVGLAGLVGSGKSEAMRAAFGAIPLSSGRVRFKGCDITRESLGNRMRAGFAYLPSDRQGEGLMMKRPVRENMVLCALDVRPISRGPVLDLVQERRTAKRLASKLNLSPNQPERTADRYSGGNQQKAMMARSLTRDFDLVVLDEPTVGVDVGTRAAIYQFIVSLAARGCAVVLVSSDLPEVLNLSSRAYVFYRGSVQAELPRASLSEDGVLAHFFGRETVP